MENRDFIPNHRELANSQDGQNIENTTPEEAGQQMYMPEEPFVPDEKLNLEAAAQPEEDLTRQSVGAPEVNVPPEHLLSPAYISSDDVVDQRPRRVKKNTSALKVIGLIVLIFVIIAGVFFSLFDFTVSKTGGGVDISIRQRGSSDRYIDVPYDGETENPLETDSDVQTTQLDTYPAGDGTTLTISSGSSQQYSLQEIYETSIPSIVLINVTLSDGEGTGTGIIMTENGYIITNDHVIEGASAVTVELQDGSAYEALLVGEDSQTDLAVLKIDVRGLTPAQFGDSTGLRVGDGVTAIGNPLGLNFSLSNGIISALDRDVEINGYNMAMIQTNTAINEGNSGGALIDMYGQVVGITNMKLVSYSVYSSIEGMAFAIPTSVIKPVVDSLIANGYVAGRPALGIMCMTLDETTAESEGLPAGVYISSIYQQSDAYGKVEEGDVVTAANGTEVLTTEALNEMKNSLGVGDTLTLTIYRDNDSFDVDIVLVDSGQIEY